MNAWSLWFGEKRKFEKGNNDMDRLRASCCGDEIEVWVENWSSTETQHRYRIRLEEAEDAVAELQEAIRLTRRAKGR